MSEQTKEKLAALEREHFGDPDKGTGIYMRRGIAWAREQAIAHLRTISADLRRDDNERYGAAAVIDELRRNAGVPAVQSPNTVPTGEQPCHKYGRDPGCKCGAICARDAEAGRVFRPNPEEKK